MKTRVLLTLSLSLAAFAGCSDRSEKAPDAHASGKQHQKAEEHAEGDGHNHAPAAADPNVMNIPESVRQNLGLTFAKAQRRRVASTLRVPGRFEALPSARREYNAVLPGRAELLVEQYQAVEAGTPLYRLESTEWLKLRQQLQEELAAISKSEAEVAVAESTKSETAQAVKALEQRVAALGEAGVRRAELEAELAAKRSSLPRLEAEVRAKQTEHQAARQRFPSTLASAASVLGIDVKTLTENSTEGKDPQPRWSTIESIEVRAAQAGVIESLGVTNGAWVEANKLVLTTLNPRALRFRAVGLQADLGKLRDGLSASIAAPRGGPSEVEPLAGKLLVGLAGNPESRTIELMVTPEKLDGWTKAGVSALLEIVTDGGEDPEIAIPVAAVVQDELIRIFFRRNPKNPDQVIRTEADLGVSDGHWVVVNSGLKAGDEVVVEGVYELKLASSANGGGAAKGHFHADGSFHEGKDGEKK